MTGTRPRGSILLVKRIRINGDCMTCKEMCWSGVRIGMLKIITQAVHRLTRRDHQMILGVSCAAAPGPTMQGAAGLPAASGSIRSAASATTDFGCRVLQKIDIILSSPPPPCHSQIFRPLWYHCCYVSLSIAFQDVQFHCV